MTASVNSSHLSEMNGVAGTHAGIQASTHINTRRAIEVYLNHFNAGLTEMPARPFAVICMFVGQSVDISCIRSGHVRRGREVAGDLDIVPAETKCAWEARQSGTSLSMRVPTSLLRSVATELDINPAHVELADRFQLRDPQIEHIGWALKADIEAGCPGGRLFRESLGTALATRLLQRHNVRSLPMRDLKGGMSALKLKQLLGHIEDNLESDLSLAEIADVAGMSISHLKTLFRNSTGVSVHQYVLRRRVERAKSLLRERDLSITQIAFATGFAHQSHLARHMRRILGITPATIRKDLI
jgi:AraC family transcriptional regulator